MAGCFGIFSSLSFHLGCNRPTSFYQAHLQNFHSCHFWHPQIQDLHVPVEMDWLCEMFM
jgi:hypothetical protein